MRFSVPCRMRCPENGDVLPRIGRPRLTRRNSHRVQCSSGKTWTIGRYNDIRCKRIVCSIKIVRVGRGNVKPIDIGGEDLQSTVLRVMECSRQGQWIRYIRCCLGQRRIRQKSLFGTNLGAHCLASGYHWRPGLGGVETSVECAGKDGSSDPLRRPTS